MELPWGSVVKNLPAREGDPGLASASGRSLGKEMAAHSSILPWGISGTWDLAG